MAIALTVLWIVWFIPLVVLLYYKHHDWYLCIFPPAVMTVLALCIAIFSDVLAIIGLIGIHVYMVVSSYIAQHRE